jgi:enamine deaminase RidA (YjgF/YER057c/UK114 family)
MELMKEHMPSGKNPVTSTPSSRINALGITLPAPPAPLGAYVESSDAGNLLFLSGTLPVANGKLAISGRLGDTLSVEQGKEAARIASLNALAVAKQHLGNLDRLKKLVKLTVLMATTEHFAEHAVVADGASDLFVQIFGREAGHVRLVYGVYSMPIGAPVIVDTVFEIEPLNVQKAVEEVLKKAAHEGTKITRKGRTQ